MTTRILVVDDDPQLLRALRINLRARDYEVEVAATAREALALAASRPPDLVVLDLGLPDLDGGEVVAGLRGWTDVPIIVLSGRSGGPRSRPSTPARTTTSPSRSGWTSCSLGSARSPAGPPPATRSRSPR